MNIQITNQFNKLYYYLFKDLYDNFRWLNDNFKLQLTIQDVWIRDKVKMKDNHNYLYNKYVTKRI